MRDGGNIHLEYFFEISVDMMSVAGVDGYFKRVNPALVRTLGYTEEELLSKPFLEFVHPEDRDSTLSDLERLANGADTNHFENRYRCKDGSWRWLSWTCPAATPDEGLLYAIARDVTEDKRLHQELVRLASYDALTGLTNRAVFLDEVTRSAARAKRTGTNIAVLFIDLDGLKPINDDLGHDAGDAMLREVASRLSSTMRQSDLVARIGGDEFAILVQDHPVHPEPVARRILTTLSQPYSFKGSACRVTASIGIATTEDARDTEELIKFADTAMYDAKREGGDRFRIYAPAPQL